MYKKVTFFCSVHVCLLHCKMRNMFLKHITHLTFVVASFALWFCHCAILLSILVKGMMI